jgi:hypothetical protein
MAARREEDGDYRSKRQSPGDRYGAKAASPRSDAYVGLLALALLAQVAGAVFLYLDYSQYPPDKDPVKIARENKAAADKLLEGKLAPGAPVPPAAQVGAQAGAQVGAPGAQVGAPGAQMGAQPGAQMGAQPGGKGP